MLKEYDYIIVGQGLAGTCLTFSLQKLGKTVLVIDSQDKPSASLVAGGLFNPVTGRKMVLTWMAADLFPKLQAYYSELESLLKVDFLINRTLYRPFLSIEEQNEWHGKWSESRFKPFVNRVVSDVYHNLPVNNPFGGLELKQSGAIRTKILLEAFRNYLESKSSYLNEEFDHSKLNQYDDHIVYKQYRALKVIFAEGPNIKNNPWFKSVKINGLKGEVLDIRTEKPIDKIVSRGLFVLPLGDDKNTCIVGSTYEHNNDSWEPSTRAREEMELKLKKLLSCDYEVIGHRAGIRPTVVDRRPVLGTHPNNSKLAIFNGLGTKGVSLGPFFAEQFASHLVTDTPLMPEVHLDRFFR